MKIRRMMLCAAIAALVTAGICSGEPGEASATGSGMFKTRGADGQPAYRTFTFQAVTHQDGTTTGTAEIHNREQGYTTQIRIDCLEVEDGKVARMSGRVERSTNPEWEGLAAWFKVADNGEGSKAEPDGITLVGFFWWDAPRCTDRWYDDLTRPIEAGNVQVR